MTFRATVRDGLIVINTHGELPDGTAVEVVRTAIGAKAKKSPAGRKARKKTRSNDDPFLAILGMCKDRLDWKGKPGSEILTSIRERSREQRLLGVLVADVTVR